MNCFCLGKMISWESLIKCVSIMGGINHLGNFLLHGAGIGNGTQDLSTGRIREPNYDSSMIQY